MAQWSASRISDFRSPGYGLSFASRNFSGRSLRRLCWPPGSDKVGMGETEMASAASVSETIAYDVSGKIQLPSFSWPADFKWPTEQAQRADRRDEGYQNRDPRPVSSKKRGHDGYEPRRPLLSGERC